MWFWVHPGDGIRLALAGVRRVKGLTQADLADQLGVNRTTVLDMEAGRNPAVDRFIRAFNYQGYDLIAVPRTASVSVKLQDKAS